MHATHGPLLRNAALPGAIAALRTVQPLRTAQPLSPNVAAFVVLPYAESCASRIEYGISPRQLDRRGQCGACGVKGLAY